MKRLAPAILFLPLVIYLLLPTKEFYWDGVAFALDIEKSNGSLNSLLEPNHLIYNLTGWLLFEALGFRVRALFLLQALNSVLAGLCVLLVYRILKEITGSRYRSVCLALLFAFSATWWRFATDADAYIPSIFFLLVCFWLLLPAKKPRPLAVAVLHTVAMLFHQLAIFFFPVVLAGLWRHTRKLSVILRYGVTAFLLTAGTYVFAYRSVSNVGGFLDWITTHSTDSAFTFNLFRSAALSLRGNLRLFLGGKLSLLKFNAVTVLGIALLAITIGLLVWRGAEIKRAARELWSAQTKQRLLAGGPLLVWIVCYLLFLLFWLPQNTFYRLFYLPAIIFLVGALGLSERAKAGRALALAVAALFLWNFTFFIYPHSRVETNEPLHFALEHRASWPQGTTIVFRDFHSDLWTISYFNPQVAWTGVASLSEVQAHTSRRLWLEGTAYDLLKQQPEGERWLASHIDMPGSLLYRSPAHTIRFYRAAR